MKLLIDTNIIMDVLVERTPFFEKSNYAVKLCADKKVQGVLAAHTLTNLFYILRKYFSVDECRGILLSLFDIFHVASVHEKNLRASLENQAFNDFEDCLQMECGREAMADYIVTRDSKHFSHSDIPCLTPDEVYAKFGAEIVGSDKP